MNLVTDTSAWIAFFKGESIPLIELGLNSGRLLVPALVKVEILGNELSPKERKAVEELLQSLPSIGVDEEHFRKAGRLKANLSEKGISMSARDAHILQSAIDHKAVLVSNDPFFIKIQESSHVKVQVW